MYGMEIMIGFFGRVDGLGLIGIWVEGRKAINIIHKVNRGKLFNSSAICNPFEQRIW